MTLRLIGLLAAVVLLTSAVHLAAQDASLGELTKELTGDKAAAPRTAEQWDAVYAKVLDALVPDLGSDDAGKRSIAQRTIERIAFNASRPDAEPERAACAKAVAARLGADGDPVGRAWLVRQLERLGRGEAVAALAQALGDENDLVRESARRALSKNPAPEAGAVLRQALGPATDPAWHAAILNAMGQRQDPADLAVLLQEAASDNDDIRNAALRGLARLGDRPAIPLATAAMTKGSPAAQRQATDSYLLLAETLVAKGDKIAALGMFRKLLASPGHLKCAAIIGLGRAGGMPELPVIFQALADPDVKLRGSAVEALVMMPGTDVTAAIVAKVNTADVATKPGLLQVLTRRGDKSALPIFVTAAQDADEAVRIEALQGLGVVGDAPIVPLLLKAAATSGKPQDAARQSLHQLKGDGVNTALLGAMGDQDAKLRLEAIRALAMRRAAVATTALLKSAQDPNAELRQEALGALGAVAPTDAMTAVADILLKTQDDPTRTRAADALARIAGREADADKRSEPILKALASPSGTARLKLLAALGRIGGAKPLAAVTAAVKDNDPQVRDAAIRALADWPDVAAAEELLSIAQTATDQTYQVLAIRGYVRVVRLENRRPAAENARMLAAALQAAKRPPEKKEALAGLAEVRHLDALTAVAPCLDDAALAQEATQAAVRISRDIVDRQPEPVKAAMQKVLTITKNTRMQEEANAVLQRAEDELKKRAPKK